MRKEFVVKAKIVAEVYVDGPVCEVFSTPIDRYHHVQVGDTLVITWRLKVTEDGLEMENQKT